MNGSCFAGGAVSSFGDVRLQSEGNGFAMFVCVVSKGRYLVFGRTKAGDGCAGSAVVAARCGGGVVVVRGAVVGVGRRLLKVRHTGSRSTAVRENTTSPAGKNCFYWPRPTFA